jgi:Fic family protein
MLFNGHAENRPPFDGNEDVFQPINKLIEWYNVQKSSSRMHPLFLAAIFHQRFTTEHIFADGNGRIGRFLLNVVLMQHDYLRLSSSRTNETNITRR